MYVAKPGMADSLADASRAASTRCVYNKYFVDEIYDAAVVKPLVEGSRDGALEGRRSGLIDGIVNGVGPSPAASAACCG